MPKIFFYHGQGVGLGGVITKPFDKPTVIDAVGATSLPITGGKAYQKPETYKLRHPKNGDPDIISVSSAETTVTGEQVNGVYRTEIITTVKGVNVRGIVTADTVIAKLISEHDDKDPEPTIHVTGSRIDGLRINGQEVKVDIDDTLFTEQGTYSKFKKKFDGGDPDLKKKWRQRFLWGDLNPDEVPDCWREQYDYASKQTSVPKAQGIVPCSVVTNASQGSGYQVFRHILTIPDFGAIFLGEVLMQDYARRLTMMRIQLGCPVEGKAMVASAEANGTWYP